MHVRCKEGNDQKFVKNILKWTRSFIPGRISAVGLRRSKAYSGHKANQGAKSSSGKLGDEVPPRIVIVDDEPMLRDLTEMLVRGCFKEAIILQFHDGEAAWEELMQHPPDLLITDMQRSGMDGWTMLPMLAELKVKYPILVASGTAKEEDVREIAGPELTVEFLVKPYSTDVFEQLLKAYVRPRAASEPPTDFPKPESERKRIITSAAWILLGLTLIVGFDVLILSSSATVPSARAVEHIGEDCTVKGCVASVRETRRGTVFLDFDYPYPNETFIAVSLGGEVPADELHQYSQRNLCVTGEIEDYNGHAEILLHSASQITFAK